MRNPFLLLVLIIGLVVVLAGQVMGQTFTTLYSFTPRLEPPWTNSDGMHPHGVLLLSGHTLYGTTWQGGTNGNGTLFAVNADGTGFTNLYTFSSLQPKLFTHTNSDGAQPEAGLTLSGNTLYGTAASGGSSGKGTVFAINTNGTDFRNLYNFTGGSDGANPHAGLLLSGNTLYGSTIGGGSNAAGTVFAIHTDGTDFTNLYSFTALSNSTNSDGANPYAALILSGNTLYGTTAFGGSSGKGTIFAVKTNGTDFTNIYRFTALDNNTNNDGANSFAGLVLRGNTLYGMANHGGAFGFGSVFAVNIDGTGITNLHSFTPIIGPSYTNSDGAYPNTGFLVLFGNTLYSTVTGGGRYNNGVVFAVNTAGTDFRSLYNFAGGSDGGDPWAGLVLSTNVLYGTANRFGGPSSDSGTVFSFFIQPQLTIIPVGESVILTWPTNYSDFFLQSATNLLSPVVWTTNSVTPVVVNGQNAVTNPISGTQKFYRLSQ